MTASVWHLRTFSADTDRVDRLMCTLDPAFAVPPTPGLFRAHCGAMLSSRLRLYGDLRRGDRRCRRYLCWNLFSAVSG
jgi:hypothetical protein